MLEVRRQALRGALCDADEGIRQAAAEALERLEAVQSLDDILQILKSGNRGLQVRAIFALEKVQSPRVYAPLLAALKVADAIFAVRRFRYWVKKNMSRLWSILFAISRILTRL